MTWPKTVGGWVALVVGLLGGLSIIGNGLYAFHEVNAYTSDVEDVREDVSRVEVVATSGLQKVNCALLNLQIRQLEERQAREGLSFREEAWLKELLREWDQLCTNGGG